MGFYDLSKEERQALVEQMKHELKSAIEDASKGVIDENFYAGILVYAMNDDTYIRKNCYLNIGKIYREDPELRDSILAMLETLYDHDNEKVRQTVVYALGEIGKTDADTVFSLFEKAFEDEHHAVRNGVIGALKQVCSKNPEPTLAFVKEHLDHDNPEVRRELIHGIELWGRTHPEDVLPLLRTCQYESNHRVRKMVIHVIGQISYKEDCLETVTDELRNWENKALVSDAANEILKVHGSYEKFSDKKVQEVETYLRKLL